MAEESMNMSQSAQNESQAAESNNASNDSQSSDRATETNKNSNQGELERMIQQAVDRATNKLGNENKNLRKQIEDLRKENLTAEQIKELEFKNKEADLADRDAKLKEKENRFFALEAIKDAGLDDGSKNALKLIDFVMGENEEEIRSKVKTFSGLINSLVSEQVAKTFKANGRTPESGGTSEANSTHTVAATIGKNAAERDSAANKVLGYYLGGKK